MYLLKYIYGSLKSTPVMMYHIKWSGFCSDADTLIDNKHLSSSDVAQRAAVLLLLMLCM